MNKILSELVNVSITDNNIFLIFYIHSHFYYFYVLDGGPLFVTTLKPTYIKV